MSSEHKTTPVVVCGRLESIGTRVIDGLKPEYEVIQFISSPEACRSEIPVLLDGQAPANPSSTLGTGNATDRPVAIVFGGGYAETFEGIHDDVEKAFGHSGSGVAWLRNDTSKAGPDVLGDEYPASVVRRVKSRLGELRREGNLGPGKNGSYWY